MGSYWADIFQFLGLASLHPSRCQLATSNPDDIVAPVALIFFARRQFPCCVTNLGYHSSLTFSFLDPPLIRRPPLAARQTSYSKRHSSFDTPREVPLPRMTAPGHGNEPHSEPAPKSTSDQPTDGDSVFSDDSAPELSRSSSMSSEQTHDFTKANRFDQLRGDRDSGYDSLEIPSYLQHASSPVHPNSRPFSTPDSSALAPPILPPQPTRPNWPPDRSSTSSLPLPSYIPYHTLPVVPPTTLEEDLAAVPSNRWNAEAGPSSHRPPPVTRSSRADSGSGNQGPATYRPPPMSRNSTMEPPNIFRNSSLPPDSYEDYDIPPPEPPKVLDPPPSEPRDEAPHEPFLSHGPPPEDAWAAIETRQSEYRLVVRLPGYNRQSM